MMFNSQELSRQGLAKANKNTGKRNVMLLNPNIFPIWVFENIILMSFLMAEKMEDEHSKSL